MTQRRMERGLRLINPGNLPKDDIPPKILGFIYRACDGRTRPGRSRACEDGARAPFYGENLLSRLEALNIDVQDGQDKKQ